MKLKTSIFLWVFLATAVPICIVTLYAVSYSERIFQEDVDREIATSLDNIASEIRRRLLLDRDLLSGLSEAPPVQDFVPVLEQIAKGNMHAELHARRERLQRLFNDIQGITSPTSRFRVLDVFGNTVVSASSDQLPGITTAQVSEATTGDLDIDAEEFSKLVAGLATGEIRSVLNSPDSIDPDTLEPVPLYDMLLALGEREKPIGYIAAKIRYQPIDRLLNVSPRLHKGKLFVAEIDPDNAERNGLVLYDDGAGISLGTRRLRVERFQSRHPVTYELVQRELFGFIDNPDSSVRTYFSEFFPYPDQLFNWVLGIKIDLDELAAPFNRLRVVILGVGLVALISSLLLAHTGARRIALPITSLAGRLTDFSRGKRLQPVESRGPYEIRRAGTAFNEMISAYERTERERDQARAQMLQKAKLASVGQFAAGIGHEINNPLHNILALTKLMNRQHPDLDDGLREDIASVQDEAQRASRIVRALLNFSRETPLETSVFEVGPWLEETLARVGPEAKRRGVQIANEIKDEYLVEGDANLLQQALLNLLINGLQASRPGQLISVMTSVDDEQLRIEVNDQGSGIVADIRDRIFDPFFTTKSASGGSGLGLSISLGVVTQHGGELLVENRPGVGLKAMILLPGARVVPRMIDKTAAGAR